MSSVVTQGVVCTGAGQVARLPRKILDARRRATGMGLVPGTLNVRVSCMETAVRLLGESALAMEGPPHLGPLRMWPVHVEVGGFRAPAFVVRHDRTRTRYLEIVADVRFRDMGVTDGTAVEVSLR